MAVFLGGCPKGPLGGYARPPPDGQKIEDPVSGTVCVKDPGTEAAVFRMRTFFFCTDESRVRFGENPERYAYR